MSASDDFTFVCLADNQVATFVDVQTMGADGVRRHAMGLLREHASASKVEIWRQEAVLEVIDRDGARILVEQDLKGDGAGSALPQAGRADTKRREPQGPVA